MENGIRFYTFIGSNIFHTLHFLQLFTKSVIKIGFAPIFLIDNFKKLEKISLTYIMLEALGLCIFNKYMHGKKIE